MCQNQTLILKRRTGGTQDFGDYDDKPVRQEGVRKSSESSESVSTLKEEIETSFENS